MSTFRTATDDQVATIISTPNRKGQTMLISQPVNIVSAEKSDYDAAKNDAETVRLGKLIEAYGHGFKAVVGKYQGGSENSFVVACGIPDALTLAREFNQESILHIDANRGATLIFVDNGRQEYLGKFQEVSAEFAQTLDNYTFDPSSGKYWSTESEE